MGNPDFACMGFQKCGTTTLYALLKQHPQIALCRDVKEPMYYRVPVPHRLYGGSRFYNWRYFGHIQPGDRRVKGEVNAGLTYGGCARRFQRYMPEDIKMIFMMRNPVDRSYSAYRYFLARGFLGLGDVRYDAEHGHAQGFDHYVHRVLDRRGPRGRVMRQRQRYMVLSQSSYATCIEEYLARFDRENMRFVVFEEFVRDQHGACRELYEFLGVSDAPEMDYGIKTNEGNERVRSPWRSKQFFLLKALNYFLYDLCAMTHWAPKLYARFRKTYLKVRRKCLEADADRSRVLPETRAFLMDYFEPEIARTEEIIGRDLHAVWDAKVPDGRNT